MKLKSDFTWVYCAATCFSWHRLSAFKVTAVSKSESVRWSTYVAMQIWCEFQNSQGHTLRNQTLLDWNLETADDDDDDDYDVDHKWLEGQCMGSSLVGY